MKGTSLKLLLDTHIWLWALLEPERLSRNARAALESPHNELWLSPISIWEALVLAERGRIKVTGDTGAWIDRMVRAMPRREATLTHEVAIESRRITLSHQDPADRFIAATARVYELTLVTADERLMHSTEFATLT
ncbi:MAG: type II toxin-antitoxin system VapC family toxin [Gemmatimonadota bacterium]|nr:type II toxin-antitoxin system VapC family toxin [Gemmatimonadota bacterium]